MQTRLNFYKAKNERKCFAMNFKKFLAYTIASALSLVTIFPATNAIISPAFVRTEEELRRDIADLDSSRWVFIRSITIGVSMAHPFWVRTDSQAMTSPHADINLDHVRTSINAFYQAIHDQNDSDFSRTMSAVMYVSGLPYWFNQFSGQEIRLVSNVNEIVSNSRNSLYSRYATPEKMIKFLGTVHRILEYIPETQRHLVPGVMLLNSERTRKDALLSNFYRRLSILFTCFNELLAQRT